MLFFYPYQKQTFINFILPLDDQHVRDYIFFGFSNYNKTHFSLIAMMGNTYTTIIAQAEKAWRRQYAQIIMALERTVGKKRLA